MPKRSRSCIFYPRLNQKEDPDGTPSHISVSYEALEVLFHLPLKNAAKEVMAAAHAAAPGGVKGGAGSPPLVLTKPGSAVGRPFLPSLLSPASTA